MNKSIFSYEPLSIMKAAGIAHREMKKGLYEEIDVIFPHKDQDNHPTLMKFKSVKDFQCYFLSDTYFASFLEKHPYLK